MSTLRSSNDGTKFGTFSGMTCSGISSIKTEIGSVFSMIAISGTLGKNISSREYVFIDGDDSEL